MSTRHVVHFFATRSEEGERLLERFIPLAAEMGFDVEPHRDSDPVEYVSLCTSAEVVVLDATVETERRHNYHFAVPLALEHVLVVSRTPLPLNFYGLREDIPDTDRTLLRGTPLYPGRLDNEQILRWLGAVLHDVRPHLPRPRGQRGWWGTMRRGYRESWDALDRRRRDSGQIFISYRSSDEKGVAALAERIRHPGSGFHDAPRVVRWFPSGLLSRELMPEQRRWQILSSIDRFIGPAEELWVYESAEYYDSWWTLGELATLGYRFANGYRGARPPRLRIYDPDADRVRDAPADYLPSLTREQQKRMARWYANSDTAGMGLESVAAIRMMGQLPLLRRFKYFSDHVWSDAFWRFPVLDCGACRTLGARRNRFDVDDFLHTQGRNFRRLTPEQAAEAASAGQIACENCGTVYSVSAAEPHHYWLPVVNGHDTGAIWMAIFGLQPQDPEETRLVPLPTFITESRKPLAAAGSRSGVGASAG
ncbi:MAG TPA: hypothetical protein VHG93_00205 [Longimicrobium sp.]|nr:hypothetical protein [Longimicrobium sp.]